LNTPATLLVANGQEDVWTPQKKRKIAGLVGYQMPTAHSVKSHNTKSLN